MKKLPLSILVACLVVGCSGPPIPEGQSPLHPRGVGKVKSASDARAMADEAQARMAGRKQGP